MRIFVFSFLVCLLCFGANAQDRQVKIKLNKETVVYDSIGNKLDYSEWFPIISSGQGSISLKIKNSTDTTFLLKRSSANEQKKLVTKMLDAEPRPSEAFTTGEVFPSFTAKNIGGKKIKSDDLKGKIVAINFWFIECAPCLREIPELNQLVKTFGKENVIFLSVCNNSALEINNFLKKNEFAYTHIPDGKSLAISKNVEAYPTHVILDEAGKVVFHTSGYGLSTVPALERNIRKLLEKEKM